MDELITGLIAVFLFVLFLGFYAVKLKSIPLWIIIVSVVAMVAFNFYEGIRKAKNDTKG